MGARNLTLMNYTLNRDQVELTAKATGAGAANPTGLKGLGIASIVRTGAGRYTVTLTDKWAGLLFCDFAVMSSAGTQFEAYPIAETVASTKTITFGTSNSAGTATDITATETLLIDIKLSNSQQTPRSY